MLQGLDANNKILGKLSVFDICAVTLTSWAPDAQALLVKPPNLKAMYERVVSVLAIIEAW